MERPQIDTTMLVALLKKQSFIKQVAETTGTNVNAGVKEIERQIRQNLAGKKVTKSGVDHFRPRSLVDA